MQNAQLQEKMIIYDKNMPFKLFHSIKEKNHRILKPHWHDHLEILYFVRGKSTALLNQQAITLTGGDTLIINPNDLHTLDLVSAGTEYFTFIIDVSFLTSSYLTNEILFTSQIVDDKNIGAFLSRIFEEYDKQKLGFDYRMKGETYYLYSYLVTHHLLSTSEAKKHYLKSKKVARLRIVLEYIEQNYTHDITCEELASMVHLSKSYFHHLFTETMKISVNSYINGVRVQKAYETLKNTTLNVSEVAIHSGFSNLNYFSRVFKKHYGYPPSHVVKE